MSAEKPLPKINFFICSTYLDLRAHRNAVIKNIQSHAGVINAQEFFGARDTKPLATCLEEVDRSDVFIIFLGPRYGAVDGDSGRSFVACEYARAKERKLPRLAYIIDDSHSFPIKHVATGSDAERLRAFKAAVRTELTVDTFTTPDDLANKVYSDLVRELPKWGFKLGGDEAGSGEITPLTLVNQFLALPKLFHGRTFTFSASLGNYSRAHLAECEAFSYRYGAAVERRFSATDTELRNAMGSALNKIYAEDNGALALMNVPRDREVTVTAKTVQGEYILQVPIYGYEHEPGMLNMTASNMLDRRRVVVDHERVSTLLCGLELIEVHSGAAPVAPSVG